MILNVDGDYEPSNCRWADNETQAINKRKNTNNKLGIRNIVFHKGSYVCRVTRKGLQREFYSHNLENAIKVRDFWLKSFKENKELWIENTENEKYKKEIDKILK